MKNNHIGMDNLVRDIKDKKIDTLILSSPARVHIDDTKELMEAVIKNKVDLIYTDPTYLVID